MSVIKLNLRKVAEAQGFDNPRELGLKAGVTYSVCYRMWYDGKQSRLDLPSLAKLCDALNCAPGDLLVLTEAKRRK